MQDTSTGELKPIDPKFLEGIPKVSQPEFARQFLEANQKAKDATIPERSHQGPIFVVGETLEIRGGKFKVHAIYGTRITFESLPSR